MEINNIIDAIQTSRISLSQHSLGEAIQDNLELDDIYFSVIESGEIIEDYPDAYPLPACLIFGQNANGEPIHSVWG